MWQSGNEGYTWEAIQPGERFIAFYMHQFTKDRAYLLTSGKTYFYTTDTGRTWHPLDGPTVPNTFGMQVLHFHPLHSDNLIWTGSVDCAGFAQDCHAEAHYTRDNGRKWTLIDKYVRNCQWARDAELKVDPNQIICESYKNKAGNQMFFGLENPLELIGGTEFFSKKTKLFDHVVGFAKFAEYLIVAEVCVYELLTTYVTHLLRSINLPGNHLICRYHSMAGPLPVVCSRRPCAWNST